MLDYHIHSKYSLDSKMSMREACEAAITLGLVEIVFTDHIDLDWPDNVFPTFKADQLDRYFEDIEKVRNAYKSWLTVKQGIEIGIQPHTLEENAKIIDSYPFDFVIASVHIVERMDPSLQKYFEGKSKEQSFIRYYEEILTLVEIFDYFSVLGHLDYIKRYSPYPHCEDDYKIGKDLIDEILKILIRKNKGIEINTSGYRHLSHSPMPNYSTIQRYFNYGGTILTLGSDAHFAKHIGYNFDVAIKELEKIGCKYLTRFSELKPHFIPLQKTQYKRIIQV